MKINNIIFIENINYNIFNENNIYFIFGYDYYLNNKIKNKIIYNINKCNILYKIDLYIHTILDWNNFIYKYFSNNLFDIKYIIIINIISKDLLLKIYIKNDLFYKKNTLIFLYNKNINLDEVSYINNNLSVYYFINCNLNNKLRFIKFVNLQIEKLKINNIKILIYNWLYSIYQNNFFIIYNILFLIKKTKKNDIIKSIIKNPLIIYINNNSWIYSILIGNYTLSIINLYIIKYRSYLKFNNLLKILEKYIIKIFYIKFNIYNINIVLKDKNDNLNKYLLITANKLNFNDIYLIIRIIKDIEINIIKYNFNINCIYDTWNKFELLTLIFCRNKDFYNINKIIDI